MKFLNKKTKTTYNGNIGHNILKKEFLGFNKNPKCDFSIEYNKQLLQKQLKEIFSENITTRINNYRQDFNKKLVERLINEKDSEKRNYFNKFFN